MIDKIWDELLVYCKDDYDKERWKNLLIKLYDTFNGKEEYNYIEKKNFTIDSGLIKNSIIEHMENLEQRLKMDRDRNKLIPDIDIENNGGEILKITTIKFFEDFLLWNVDRKISWGWVHYCSLVL